MPSRASIKRVNLFFLPSSTPSHLTDSQMKINFLQLRQIPALVTHEMTQLDRSQPGGVLGKIIINKNSRLPTTPSSSFLIPEWQSSPEIVQWQDGKVKERGTDCLIYLEKDQRETQHEFFSVSNRLDFHSFRVKVVGYGEKSEKPLDCEVGLLPKELDFEMICTPYLKDLYRFQFSRDIRFRYKSFRITLFVPDKHAFEIPFVQFDCRWLEERDTTAVRGDHHPPPQYHHPVDREYFLKPVPEWDWNRYERERERLEPSPRRANSRDEKPTYHIRSRSRSRSPKRLRRRRIEPEAEEQVPYAVGPRTSGSNDFPLVDKGRWGASRNKEEAGTQEKEDPKFRQKEKTETREKDEIGDQEKEVRRKETEEDEDDDDDEMEPGERLRLENERMEAMLERLKKEREFSRRKAELDQEKDSLLSELAELEAEHALLKKEAASSATPSLRASRTSRSIETVLPTPPPPTKRYDGKVSDHSKKAYGVGAPG